MTTILNNWTVEKGDYPTVVCWDCVKTITVTDLSYELDQTRNKPPWIRYHGIDRAGNKLVFDGTTLLDPLLIHCISRAKKRSWVQIDYLGKVQNGLKNFKVEIIGKDGATKRRWKNGWVKLS